MRPDSDRLLLSPALSRIRRFEAPPTMTASSVGCGLRVLRGGALRIWSGPEGSSHKRFASGAAVTPGGRTEPATSAFLGSEPVLAIRFLHARRRPTRQNAVPPRCHFISG